MVKTDARRLTHTELTELRKRGVSAVQCGQSVAMVAKVLGVQRSTLFGWLARYRRGGWDALDAHKRGGRPLKLTVQMQEWIYDTVTMKDPQQMKFTCALWTGSMAKELIGRQFGIRLSKASVYRVLHQLDLSPRRPLWRAFQKNPERVEKWMKEEYPRIRDLAKKQKAGIFFGDETEVLPDFNSDKISASRDKALTTPSTEAPFAYNMISATDPRGAMRFMLVDDEVSGEIFVEFLERLIKDWPRFIFLIVDGRTLYKSAVVSRFVATVEGKLRLFRLPPYSP